MASVIDAEVKRIVEEAHAKATHLLTEHLDELHIIAKAMLEYETLTGDEINALIKGEPIRRADESLTKKPAGRSALPTSKKV